MTGIQNGDVHTGGRVRTQEYRRQGWWTDETLWNRYAKHAAANPTGLAVADDRGVELTHAGLCEAARLLAARLQESGVRAGDLVLVIMPNAAEWQVVFAGLLRIGAIPMTIPITTDGATLTYLCDLAEVTAVVTATRAGSTSLGEVAVDAVSKADRSTTVVIVDDVLYTGRTVRAAIEFRYATSLPDSGGSGEDIGVLEAIHYEGLPSEMEQALRQKLDKYVGTPHSNHQMRDIWGQATALEGLERTAKRLVGTWRIEGSRRFSLTLKLSDREATAIAPPPPLFEPPPDGVQRVRVGGGVTCSSQ